MSGGAKRRWSVKRSHCRKSVVRARVGGGVSTAKRASRWTLFLCCRSGLFPSLSPPLQRVVLSRSFSALLLLPLLFMSFFHRCRSIPFYLSRGVVAVRTCYLALLNVLRKKITAGAACASAPRPTSAWIEKGVRLAQKVQVDPCISVGVHL
jgi:hypothetical protein